MTLVRNALTGVQLFDADNGRVGATVRDSVFDSNGETGLQLMSGTEGALIENNYFVSNGMSIHVFDSHRNVIRNNTISGIILDPALDSDAGIVLENGSRQNVLEDNDVSDTGDAGIVIHQGSHGNIVRGGVLVRNGDAGVIVQDSDRIEVDGVLAHQQSDGGVVLSNSSNSTVKNSELGYNPSGVDASGTNNLVVENNDVSHSLQAGIELGDGVNMVIRNNIANHNGGSGISMEGAAFDANGVAVGGALIEGNTAHENAESGISVATGRHTIRNNTANLNAGYGIEAGEDPVPGEPLDPNREHRRRRQHGSRQPRRRRRRARPARRGPVRRRGLRDRRRRVPITPADLEAPQTTLTSTPPAVTGNETAVFEFTANDGPNGDPRDRDDLRVPPRRAAGPAGAAGGARARAARPERAARPARAAGGRVLGRVLEPADLPQPRAGHGPPLRGARGRPGRQLRPHPRRVHLADRAPASRRTAPRSAAPARPSASTAPSPASPRTPASPPRPVS